VEKLALGVQNWQYISETVEDRAKLQKLLLTAYIKSYTGFRSMYLIEIQGN